MQTIIEGGFGEPVLDAQSAFRAVMEAFSRPGSWHPLGVSSRPPLPLTPELGAIALTLCDHDSPVWLDPVLATNAAVVGWLKFQCGAPVTADPGKAQFALVSDAALLPPLETFALGTDEYPDRSATIAVMAPETTRRLVLRGPGIKGSVTSDYPWPTQQFTQQWHDNRAAFPRGVDLLLCRDGAVLGLPRSTRIEEA